MSTIAAVLSLRYAKRLVVTKQASYATKLLKLFYEAKKHTSRSANKAAKNAANQDCLEDNRLKEPYTLLRE